MSVILFRLQCVNKLTHCSLGDVAVQFYKFQTQLEGSYLEYLQKQYIGIVAN